MHRHNKLEQSNLTVIVVNWTMYLIRYNHCQMVILFFQNVLDDLQALIIILFPFLTGLPKLRGRNRVFRIFTKWSGTLLYQFFIFNVVSQKKFNIHLM